MWPRGLAQGAARSGDASPPHRQAIPDASKRGQPMLGLNVVHGLQPIGENKWSGAIYNADEGKSYAVNVKLVSSNKLALQGCVLRVFCKSQTWTRVE